MKRVKKNVTEYKLLIMTPEGQVVKTEWTRDYEYLEGHVSNLHVLGYKTLVREVSFDW